MSGGVTLPAIPGATGQESRPSSRAESSKSIPQNHLRNSTPRAYYSDLPSFRSTPGRHHGGGVARSYTKLPSLRHTPRQSRNSMRSDVRSRYSAKYRRSPGPSNRHSADSPFLPKATTEDCLKCLLRVPHKKCESHKYIRVGGGYRHGYWYIKCLLEQIELQRKKELLEMQRLEAIKEKRVMAVKTYIRTKSGRLVERIIFLSEEDYEAFKEGKNVADLLKKYLTSDEAAGLESWDKDEVVAIKTYVRTKSGRLEERLIYVSKDDYDAIREGRADANELLKKYVTGDGECIEGWGEAKMKTIKTYVRTKSGRLVEKVIMISEDDYNRMIKEGMDPNEILKNYLPLGEGETIEGWQSGEPMKEIKTLIRTKSGRLIEKTIFISADDYDRMMKEGADPNAILNKYLDPEEQGQIESWDRVPDAGMKAIKTKIRTKSGRIIEKTIYVTEEDYDIMMKEGGDPSSILNKYLKPEERGNIESWEKVPEPGMKAIKTKIRTKSGRIIEKTIYVTEEDYDKMMKEGGDPSSILNKYLKPDERGTIQSWEKVPEGNPMKVVKTYVRTKSGRLIEKTVMMTDEEYKKFQESGGDPEFLKKFLKLEEGETIEDWEKASTVYDDDDPEIQKAKAGTRIVGKDGAVYEVVVDPVTGKKYKKKVGHVGADGTFIPSKGEKGKGRMKVRKDKDGNIIITEETDQERARRKKGKRDADSDSDYSYRSVVSAGGTRRVRRRKKNADGTYGDSESFNSSDDEEGAARRRRRRRARAHGSDSEHSYYSIVSEGGTRHVRRKKRRADGTYSNSESYHSDDSALAGGGLAKKKQQKKKKRGGSGSDYSYYSETSEGGTRRTMRKKRLRDKEGKVIGHGKAEEYESSDAESHYTEVSDGKGGKIRVKKPKEGKTGKGGKQKKWYDDVAQFSDATTDSDAVDLDAMSPEERERYLAERSKRREAREQRRREKYGDKYDEMFAANAARKKDKKAQEEKQERLRAEQEKKKKGKSGNEADDESDEDEIDPLTGRRKKKLLAHGKGQKSSDGQYEYEYDEQGRVIKKKRIGGKGGADSGSEYEYEYDEHGNVKIVKKIEKRQGSHDSDDGQYFEVDEKGQLRLKQGKKKIDLSKLTDEDLRRLGIDPSLSKQEIARLLKEKFGKDIEITDKKKKVGTRRLSEYGSDANTDDLADDSDLDVSTLTGTRRVNVLMKRGGQALADHMQRVIDQSRLHEPGESAKDLDERDGVIDFLSHYKLVDSRKLESYARAFVVEDDDFDTVIGSQETRTALDGVPSTEHITAKQMEYVLKVLKIDDASQVTFRMFAVITAVSERVTQMDPLSKHLLNICDLLDIERKMDLYRSMFYCNVNSDRDDVNYIKADSLRIELIAGGLSWKQQQHIMDRLLPNIFNEISFLDYICYIPLFLSMHDNIVDNPLDMSDSKYDGLTRKLSGRERQRDMNPLGQPLSRASTHIVKHDAKELLEGKLTLDDIRPQVKQELVHKYSKAYSSKVTDLKKLKDKLKGMTREEIRELKKTGKLKELLGDAYDSEASFMRTNTTLSAISQEDDSGSEGESRTGYRKSKVKNYDSDGSKRRKSKAWLREGGGGKKKGKKGRGDDDTDDSEHEKKGKDKKKKKGTGKSDDDDEDNERENEKGSSKGTEGNPEDQVEEYSDCSYRSEVSEGGTHYKMKMKRVRDKDGNIIGYGAPEPVPDEFRGASVLGREGSVSGESQPGYHDSFKPGDLGLPEDQKDLMGREPAWKKDRERRRQSKLDAHGIAAANEERGSGPGDEMGMGKDGAQNDTDRIPSAFSDATTASDLVDMSKMTEEEKAEYLKQRELRQRQHEERRRAKYGNKYDEIMRKKQEKKERERLALEEKQTAEEEERLEEERLEREKQEAEKEEAKKRRMSNSTKTTTSMMQKKEKPKSMVTYEKAPPRGLEGPIKKTDSRPLGPSHNDWLKSDRRLSREDSSMSSYTKQPAYQRMKTTDDLGKGGQHKRRMPNRGEVIDRGKQRQFVEDAKQLQNKVDNDDDVLIEFDESGKVCLKLGKKIDISKLSDDMLKKLGIDPNLSQQEKAKLLKKLLGEHVTIMDGGQPMGFKSINDYNLSEVDDDMLADDPELDISTLSGQRRVNILMRWGGLNLKEHMTRVMEESHLMDDQAYRNDLDEKALAALMTLTKLLDQPKYMYMCADGSVDFMTHYRLVNPINLEGYARAFVVEDQDLDTVITLKESKTALEGIPTVQHMTPKQLDYVFRVLNITDATQVTFRMFAVITALCERVSSMDNLSKHLLEMCNLADIERKLELYTNMFYHNRRGDRDGNYIKADSLKIELIAGGLNWKQQRYIMEKMEVNEFNEISFLDYMCYIPLFLSMHDNIVDNPLDMSDQKYTVPPRTRPPSSQRDVNPLGFPLKKKSSLLMRKQARDLMEGKLNAAGLRPETRDRLKRYSRLPPIKPFHRPSLASSQTSDLSSERTKTDFFLGQ